MKNVLLAAVFTLFLVGCSSKEDKTAAPAAPPAQNANPAAPALTSSSPGSDSNPPKPTVLPAVDTPAVPAAKGIAETSATAGSLTTSSVPASASSAATSADVTTEKPNAPTNLTAAVSADPATDLITRGLKEALGKGLDQAIATLGKEGGFLTNAAVRIPMPEKLQAIEKLLRRAGQDKLADDFVASMNRAAEKAVPTAAGVFKESLKQMTVEDARGILQGPKDAATQYFRRKAGPQIQEKFKPIVAQATSEAGVTAAYKNLIDKVGFAGAFLKQESLDLDDYVTSQASNGLFKMVADQEAKIRQNPVERTTDLLKSVFGRLGK